jgi:hypothetical protein
MTDEQRGELLALDAATCSIEELNKAALLIGGLDQYIKQGKHNRIWLYITPVSDSDWAAGFAMDALIHMSGDLYADTNGCSNGHLSAVMFYPIDLNATGRTAMCECIHRARLAHWQAEEKNPGSQ